MKNLIHETMINFASKVKARGLIHLTTDNTGFTDNYFISQNKKYINFALCDYLGLTQDERIKESSIREIRNHGVFSSVSKTYLKLSLYDQAEEELTKIFEKPTLLFPKTTIAHIGVLPALIDANDAVILDHQVHTSVRLASDILKSYGTHVDTVRHNRMDLLEQKIIELKNKYHNIWYLADGVYSTYGDKLHFKEINQLLEKYNQFHLYVDDSHGMSYIGKNGRGYVNTHLINSPKTIVSTSLCKGFGAEGAAIICPDIKIKQKLLICAAPLIFCGPLSPGALGSILGSAQIHLSDEITERQKRLQSLIEFANTTSKELNLPLLSDPKSPILFYAAGETDFCLDICSNLLESGYFVNIFHYPAVPLNNAGVRVTLNLNLNEDDIYNMLKSMRKAYDIAINKFNSPIDHILKYFKKDMADQVAIVQSNNLVIEEENSVYV